MLSTSLSLGPQFVEALEPRQFLSVATNSFKQTNLVSDGSVAGTIVDPGLVNPWGIAFASTTGPIWVSDNGKGITTVYNTAGIKVAADVTIPPPSGTGTSAPTGVVRNNTSTFLVSNGTTSAAATYLFATEDGTLAGWNPNVNATNAFLVVNNAANNAVYKGLAIATRGRANMLYAADFHNGRIDVFNSSFKPVTLTKAFTDPNLPAGFAPFNVVNINNQLFVTYAKQDAAKHDDVHGAGNGFIDVFTTSGRFVRRFASRGRLNSPWGMAVAPARFGPFQGDILVGNFGNGRINVFSPAGKLVGTLNDRAGKAITIDGLWGIAFAPQTTARTPALFFASGPQDETHGLFGKLFPARPTTTTVTRASTSPHTTA